MPAGRVEALPLSHVGARQAAGAWALTHHPLARYAGYTPYDLIDFSDIPLKHEVVAKVDRPIRWAGTLCCKRDEAGVAAH